jgi:myo-inositol-1(or 4)-monophosphatase
VNSDERAAVATTLADILDECREHILTSSPTRSWGKSSLRGGPDVVTGLDVWVEERIIASVSRAYPECATFSEESQGDPSDLRGPLCFVIDPIDGTSELLLGESSFAVSVALVCDGSVEVGLLDFPKRGLRYEARRDEGAWTSGRRLIVPELTTLAGASIAVTPRQRTNPELQPIFARLEACELVDMRPITAKLIAIASGEVAAGVYLRHPGSEVAIWDYAAAALVLEEAGGVFTNMSDRQPILDLLPIRHQDGWIASSPSLHGPLLATIDGASPQHA